MYGIYLCKLLKLRIVLTIILKFIYENILGVINKFRVYIRFNIMQDTPYNFRNKNIGYNSRWGNISYIHNLDNLII